MKILPAHRELFVEIASVFLVLAAAVRFFVVDADQLRLARSNRARDALMPRFASLTGIDASGEVTGPSRDKSGYSLVFVIRADSTSIDVAFWNDVIRMIGARAGEVSYIGVCDKGRACNAAQPAAAFPILGYLDPYQMRIVARAHARDEVLLYKDHSLEARPTLAAEAKVMSRVIGERLK